MRFSELFKREQPAREIHETRELAELRGPLTARQALATILPQAQALDPECVLTFVGSDESVNHEGRAYAWDFFFHSARSQRLFDFSVHLCAGEGDDEGPWCVDMHVRPLHPSLLRPALPLEFIDSADAIKPLAEQGADFISGDGHMTLASKILPDGAVVWHTICWDREYQTPFA